MPLVVSRARERREPDESMLSLAHREGGEIVLCVLGLEASDDRSAGRGQERHHATREEAIEFVVDGRSEQVDRGDEQRRSSLEERAVRLTIGRAQEQYVVRVDHGRVGGAAVGLPDRAAIERLQRLGARWHVAKAAQPDEAIGIVEVAELTEEPDARRSLGLDELLLEEADQVLAPAGVERVLPQLEDGIYVLHHGYADSGRLDTKQ